VKFDALGGGIVCCADGQERFGMRGRDAFTVRSTDAESEENLVLVVGWMHWSRGVEEGEA
jgi:hypothetical protein